MKSIDYALVLFLSNLEREMISLINLSYSFGLLIAARRRRRATNIRKTVSCLRLKKLDNNKLNTSCSESNPSPVPGVIENTLKVLQWDQLCDSVASFAGTSSGRQATKAELWCLNQSFQHSLKLLAETNAAVEMHNHATCIMDFNPINTDFVFSAIEHAHRDFPVEATHAIALVNMLLIADSLQINLNSAIKQDSHSLQRFMPVADMVPLRSCLFTS